MTPEQLTQVDHRLRTRGYVITSACLGSGPAEGLNTFEVAPLAAGGARRCFHLDGSPVKPSTPDAVVREVKAALAHARNPSKPAAELPSVPRPSDPTTVAWAQIDGEIQRIRAHGSVSVRRAEGGVFGDSSLSWADPQANCVTWQAWLSETVQELSTLSGARLSPESWARATSNPAATWPASGRAFVRRVWTAALAKVAEGALELPLVLDMRGLPETHGVLDQDFSGPLGDALRIRASGAILLVDENSWALDRILT